VKVIYIVTIKPIKLEYFKDDKFLNKLNGIVIKTTNKTGQNGVLGLTLHNIKFKIFKNFN
jgi:hypothetical protein